jgi:hypothetical protein
MYLKRNTCVLSNITNFMELNPSWEATSYAATQEFLKIVWNPKVHYRAQKNPSLIPILIQNDAVIQSHPIPLRSIVKLSTHLRLRLPSGISTTTTNIYMHPSRPHSCYMPANFILSYLTIQITLGEENKLWCSSI